MATKKRNRKRDVAVTVAVIAAVGTISAALINRSFSGKEPNKAQAPNQQVLNSPATTQVSIRTGSNSPVSISDSFNKTTVNNFESRRTFVSPDSAMIESMKKRAAAFRNSHPGVQIIVEAETGSVARERVGETIGSVLEAEKLGRWHAGTMIGIASGAAISFLDAPNQQDLARDATLIFDGYLKASGRLQAARTQPSNSVRVYLYGTPTFSTNGLVTLE